MRKDNEDKRCCAYAKQPMSSSHIRITAVRRRFDPEAFAAVLVAAALARLDEERAGQEAEERTLDSEDGDE
jgi:hypothetical protein